MIVRRIREHAAELNWLAVGIDLIVAIVGVFAGIQVSNWNQARGELAQGHEDRQRLIADLDVNRADYLNRVAYYRMVQRHALAALAALDRPAAASGETFLIDAYQASQIAPREAKHVAWDEIVATGRSTRLGPAQLRDSIGNYYGILRTTGVIMDYVPPYRERLRRAMPGAVQFAIRARCPEDYRFQPDGTVLSMLTDRCTLGLDDATVAAGVSAVRAMPELAQELNRVIGDTNGKLELLGTALRNVRELRAKVAAADAG